MNHRPASLRRTATVDLARFGANLAQLLDDDPALVLDARADAYGHGIEQVVCAALAAGVSTVMVSPGQANISGVKRSALMTVPTKRHLIGAQAYGLDGKHAAVMTVTGEVIAVKNVEGNAGVSYGYSYRTAEPTTLALVALGYADGLPRLASNRASVAVAGGMYPLVGRVAMDQFVVDCGAAQPTIGDDAVVFGQASAGHPSAVDLATHTERTALELTAGLGSRIERVYLTAGSS